LRSEGENQNEPKSPNANTNAILDDDKFAFGGDTKNHAQNTSDITSDERKNAMNATLRNKLGEQEQEEARPDIYRIGNTDQFGCNDCKLRGDKWFMQEHECRGGNGNARSRNTVADMAEAPLRQWNHAWE
jgi:hypothetical protein